MRNGRGGDRIVNNNMTINILGTEYTIIECGKHEDDYLNRCDGYCDKTSKKIVVGLKENDCELEDFGAYRKKVMRHEIIHAFLFESGLGENWEHQVGHDETYVDWIAMQFPKIMKAYEEAGCQ